MELVPFSIAVRQTKDALKIKNDTKQVNFFLTMSQLVK